MQNQSQGARTMKLLYAGAAALIIAGCSGGASAPPLTPLRSTSQLAPRSVRPAVGLGKILSRRADLRVRHRPQRERRRARHVHQRGDVRPG
jgi:hypothetical protein